MIVHSEQELLAELKRLEGLYGRLAELYHWAAKFWLVSSFWFFAATVAILIGNTRMWLVLCLSGTFFALIGYLIGLRGKRIERKEGLL